MNDSIYLFRTNQITTNDVTAPVVDRAVEIPEVEEEVRAELHEERHHAVRASTVVNHNHHHNNNRPKN